MKRQLTFLTLFISSTLLFTGCDFLGSVFKTGVGVGVFVAIIVVILIVFIARMGRRRP